LLLDRQVIANHALVAAAAAAIVHPVLAAGTTAKRRLTATSEWQMSWCPSHRSGHQQQQQQADRQAAGVDEPQHSILYNS
jgi:hypothetical protein